MADAADGRDRGEETGAAKERSAMREMFQRSRRGEMVAIAASGLAGALSLAVATYNVYLQRAQVRAQVWPHVEWTYNNTDGFEFDLANTGVGPARILGIELSREGHAFRSWNDAWASLTKDDPRLLGAHIETHSTTVGRVVPPGGVIHAIHVLGPEGWYQDDNRRALSVALTSLHAKICYGSTLDECWLADDSLSSASPVPSCDRHDLTFHD